MSVALGLAEGRPARRSPRKLVPRLLASVDGVTSKIVDVSSEGVRLEIAGASPSALPPYFILKVPAFGVAAKVKRVWVAMPAQGTCGAAASSRSRRRKPPPRHAVADVREDGARLATDRLSTGGLVMLKQLD